MARTGWSATNFLRHGVGLVTAAPLTMAAWCWTTSTTEQQTILWVGEAAEANTPRDQFRLGLDAAAHVQANTGNSAGSTAALSSTTYSASTWFHAAGVFDITTATDRAAFLNGGGKGTNTTNRVPAGIDRTSIGFNDNAAPANPFGGTGTGYIAEVGLWNTNLTDSEILVLARGASPLLVRPGNLVAYWPLLGRHSPEIDLVGGANMAIQGTLSHSGNHAPIYYPSRTRFIPVPPVVVVPTIDFSPGSSTAGHTTTPFSLTASRNLAFANITAGHTAAAFGLTAAYTLPVVSATAGHEATFIDLSRAFTVTPVAATVGHTADAAALATAKIVQAANAEVGHTSDPIALTLARLLTLVNADAGHTVGAGGLTLARVISAANAEAGHTATALGLSSIITVGIATPIAGHIAEPMLIFVPQQGPYDFSVSPETRVLAVTNDGRAFAIPARVESFTVNGETRLLVIPKRTVTVVCYEDRRVGFDSRKFIVSPRQTGTVQRQGSTTTSTTPPETDFILQEDGNYLLQEDGSRIRV